LQAGKNFPLLSLCEACREHDRRRGKHGLIASTTGSSREDFTARRQQFQRVCSASRATPACQVFPLLFRECPLVLLPVVQRPPWVSRYAVRKTSRYLQADNGGLLR